MVIRHCGTTSREAGHCVDVGKHVLELGCGAAGLAAVAASRSARRVVCTDGSAEALRLLGRNLAANTHLFLAERVTLRQLVWDDARHIAALQVIGRCTALWTNPHWVWHALL
jgi:predicted RNA methylase